jgi:hypothetical protein
MVFVIYEKVSDCRRFGDRPQPDSSGNESKRLSLAAVVLADVLSLSSSKVESYVGNDMRLASG